MLFQRSSSRADSGRVDLSAASAFGITPFHSPRFPHQYSLLLNLTKGFLMSAKRSLNGSRWTRWICFSLTGVSMIASAQIVHAEGGLHFVDGVVGGLANLSAMRIPAKSEIVVAAPEVRSRISAIDSLARQSVPVRDRAASYGRGDLFAHSQAALPMLVADLRPRPRSSARPMAGRSVGALPAAKWTVTPAMGVPPMPQPGKSRPVNASWAYLR